MFGGEGRRKGPTCWRTQKTAMKSRRNVGTGRAGGGGAAWGCQVFSLVICLQIPSPNPNPPSLHHWQRRNSLPGSGRQLEQEYFPKMTLEKTGPPQFYPSTDPLSRLGTNIDYTNIRLMKTLSTLSLIHLRDSRAWVGPRRSQESDDAPSLQEERTKKGTGATERGQGGQDSGRDSGLTNSPRGQWGSVSFCQLQTTQCVCMSVCTCVCIIYI